MVTGCWPPRGLRDSWRFDDERLLEVHPKGVAPCDGVAENHASVVFEGNRDANGDIEKFQGAVKANNECGLRVQVLPDLLDAPEFWATHTVFLG